MCNAALILVFPHPWMFNVEKTSLLLECIYLGHNCGFKSCISLLRAFRDTSST